MKTSELIFNKVNRFLELFLITIFTLLVLDVLFQVFSRYILGGSFSWTEEFARFSLIWMTIVGAAYLNAKKEHLSMDFLYQKFSEPNKRKASILVEVFIFLFALMVMVIGGINLVYTTLHLEQLSGTLRIPLGYVYAILPFSGLLIMCYSIYHISSVFSKKIYKLMMSIEVLSIIVLFVSFIVLLLLKVPVAYSIGIATTLSLLLNIDRMPGLTTIAQRMTTGIDSFALLAIPFFILAGEIMKRGGIANRLINFAKSLVASLPGGLAYVNVLASMLFGAISGSALAAASAIGSIMTDQNGRRRVPKNVQRICKYHVFNNRLINSTK